MERHKWKEDTAYTGRFNKKDVCEKCGAIRLSYFTHKKGIAHPVAAHFYCKGEIAYKDIRPRCTQQNDAQMQSLDIFNQAVHKHFTTPHQ